MFKLTAEQSRVIGVLLEKETTTPDHYPLSLNSLTNACNQKSSREPVMDLTESEVQDLLDQLTTQHLVGEQTGFGSRIIKYKHRFCNTEFGSLQFTPQQRAIVCLLLLRGPQTPGELRTRSNRLADFTNVDEVEAALSSLSDHCEGQLVAKLEREPGKRESRYAQLFSELSAPEKIVPEQIPASTTEPSPQPQSDANQRIDELERRVDQLTQQVEKLTVLLAN
ncbi:MAG: DUF480 domain-containing protein [Gammaproteobacteria bacterium]|nr:DUF480 domain-containing protein [Gammaproteobacteria bacterium]